MNLDRGLADDRAAVEQLIAAARRVPSARWDQAAAEGKWSAAQHVTHIALGYEMMAADVRGERTAMLVGTRFKRLIWRLLGLTQILLARRMPRGAPAPRELRPGGESPPPDVAIERLRRARDDFDRTLRDAAVSHSRHRATHPYFGGVTLKQLTVLAAVHTRHHARALDEISSR